MEISESRVSSGQQPPERGYLPENGAKAIKEELKNEKKLSPNENI